MVEKLALHSDYYLRQCCCLSGLKQDVIPVWLLLHRMGYVGAQSLAGTNPESSLVAQMK